MNVKMGSLYREIVFGLEDSLVSTLGAVTGIAAAAANNKTVILAGIVYVAVESLSMVAGAFISSKTEAEVEMNQLEKKRERLRLKPKEELEELDKFLKKHGLGDSERSEVLLAVSQNPKWFLEEVAVHELGISPLAGNQPFINSFAIGISYVFGGVIPILPYFIFSGGRAILFSMLLTLIAVVAMGILKARVGGTSVRKNLIEVVGISVVVTLVGYFVGQLVKRVLGLSLI